tara:strand:- start:219 stop:395 length:177 start_codon:yes stop_codon:yes gene_type:complete
MLKYLGLTFTILGAIALILGIIGIFGAPIIQINSWALSILGIIFFSSGLGLLKKTEGS